jgi:predicted alpha/beta superfamily hydrolase
MLAMLRATAITLALLLFPTVIFSQAQPHVTFAPVVKGLVLQDVECTEFHSRFTGHDYHVYVSLPASYRQGDRRYPVLYVPDLEEGFLLVRGANDLMGLASVLKNFILEEFILVGVPLKSENVQEWARKRTFDLTPTEDEAADKYWSNILGGEVHSGGAPLFLRTLKEELIPYIEVKYRVTLDRGLAGYSFGGLFAAYVLFNDGSTFSRYLIGSPSLWWDKGTILKTEADFAKSSKALHGRVFLSVGADEGEDMVGPFKILTTATTSHAYPDLRVETHIFESTDHFSGMPGALTRGLRFLYARPQPKQ